MTPQKERSMSLVVKRLVYFCLSQTNALFVNGFLPAGRWDDNVLWEEHRRHRRKREKKLLRTWSEG